MNTLRGPICFKLRCPHLGKQLEIAENLFSAIVLLTWLLKLTLQLAPSFLLHSLKHSSTDAWQSPLNLKHFSHSLQNIVFLAVIYKSTTRTMAVVLTEVYLCLTLFLHQDWRIQITPNNLPPPKCCDFKAHMYFYCIAFLHVDSSRDSSQITDSEQTTGSLACLHWRQKQRCVCWALVTTVHTASFMCLLQSSTMFYTML